MTFLLDQCSRHPHRILVFVPLDALRELSLVFFAFQSGFGFEKVSPLYQVLIVSRYALSMNYSMGEEVLYIIVVHDDNVVGARLDSPERPDES